MNALIRNSLAMASLVLAAAGYGQTTVEGVVGSLADDGLTFVVVPVRWDWDPAAQTTVTRAPDTAVTFQDGRPAPPDALAIGARVSATLRPASARAETITLLPPPRSPSEDDIAALF